MAPPGALPPRAAPFMSLMPSRIITYFTPGCAEHIAVETSQRADARAVAEHAVAGDAQIQHRKVGRRFIGDQPLREQRRPALVGVDRGGGAVGDRIAEGHDGSGIWRAPSRRRWRSNTRRESWSRRPCRPRRWCRRFGDVGGVQSLRVSRSASGIAGNVHADGQVAQLGHVEIDRIAQQRRAHQDAGVGLAVEQQRTVRAGNNRGVLARAARCAPQPNPPEPCRRRWRTRLAPAFRRYWCGRSCARFDLPASPSARQEAQPARQPLPSRALVPEVLPRVHFRVRRHGRLRRIPVLAVRSPTWRPNEPHFAPPPAAQSAQPVPRPSRLSVDF